MAWWRKIFGLGRKDGAPAQPGPEAVPARPAAIRPDDPRIAEGRDVAVWHPRVPGGDSHAGRTETSMMLHLDPDAVRVLVDTVR